jgi:hypothetical protein
LNSPLDSAVADLPAPITDAAEHNLLLHWIVRLRWPIFILLAMIQIASFNGRWRIGRDGSLYREVAHNLASGQGYTFRSQRETHIYPGLPRMLAVVEKIVGREDTLRPTVSLSIMAILGGLTLLTVYHLVRMHFPLWIAVCVTTGVGINREFLDQSHDFMTDVPFLLGICLTLLGIGRLARETTRVRIAAFALLAAVGAIIAISTRPTFWALAIPCVGLSIAGMICSRRRWWYAAGAAAVLAMLLLWWMLDPRTSGLHPFSGKYEQSAVAHLRNLDVVRSPGRLLYTWEKEFPFGLFGLELLFPLGTLLGLAIVACWLRLLRKLPLWSLYVVTTMLMMVLLGGKPRYYLMILPMMLIAWGLIVHWASLRVRRWRYAPECVMLLGLGLGTVPNLARSIGFILEQHGIDRGFRHRGFLNVYREGKMLPVYQIGQLIKQNVPPGANVIGPEPRITTFISGRSVYTAYETIQRTRPPESLRRLKKLNPQYLAFGPQFDNDRLLREIIRRRLVRIDWKTAARQGEMHVVKITVPEPRRPKPAPPRPPQTQPVHRIGV